MIESRPAGKPIALERTSVAEQTFAQLVERRGAVAVEHEPRRQPDDAAGAQAEEGAPAGGQLAGGDERGDAPAGLAPVVPDLAADDVLRPLAR